MLYTLKSRMMFTFSLLLIVPFVTMLVIFSEQSKGSVEEIMKASSSQTMEHYAAYLNSLNTQVEDIAYQILGNDITQRWLHTPGYQTTPVSNETYLSNVKMRGFLASLALSHSNVVSITLFDQEGYAVGIDSVYSHVDPQDYERFKKALSDGPGWLSSHKDAYQPHHIQNQPVNSLIFPLVDLESLSVRGIIKINVLTSYFTEPLEKVKLNDWSKIYLVDQSGVSLMSGEPEMDLLAHDEQWQQLQNWTLEQDVFQINNKQGQNLFWFFRKLPEQKWTIVGEITEKELFHTINSTQQMMLMISGALLLLTIVAAYWISSDIVKPLSKLSKAMKKLEMGDFQVAEQITTTNKGEAGYVIRVFVQMVKRLNHLIREEFTLKLRRRDAEYKALLMQVNPHFLYNTLEVIGGLAAQKKHDEVMDVTESLGQMLRYSLQLDTEIAPLQSELSYVKHYVAIIESRFEDEVEFIFEEDRSIQYVKIVKFILQPLVENAVKYSREHTPKALIKIIAVKQANKLLLEVTDNGKGMGTAEVEQIMKDAYSQEISDVLGSTGKQIGLRNVLARCRLYYGDEFEVEIHTKEGVGTSIQMKLPISEGLDDVSNIAGR